MKNLKIRVVCLVILFATILSIPAHSGTRYFSAMDIEVIRDEQFSGASGSGSIGSGGVSGSGSSSSSGSGAVLGVLFECSFAMFSGCETSDQKYVPVDGDPITF